MAAPQRIVIVGGGLAGAKAAETLREQGFDGDLTIVGAERERPYERPPLSKEVLRGEKDRETARVHEEGFYAGADIALRARRGRDRARPRRPDGRRSTAATPPVRPPAHRHRRRAAAPGRARRRPARGAALRTLDDSDAPAATSRGRRAPGGDRRRLDRLRGRGVGARELGAEVTMVEMADVPARAGPRPRIGGLYADLHREHGVELLTGAAPGGGRGRRPRRAASAWRAGARSTAPPCSSASAWRPRTALAEAAGLAVDNGILVDATPADGRARRLRRRRRRQRPRTRSTTAGVRVEHWANALNQGPCAARNMLGAGEPYDRLPYFFSDQYDAGMEYSGLASADDEVVIRGDAAARELIAFWVARGTRPGRR